MLDLLKNLAVVAGALLVAFVVFPAWLGVCTRAAAIGWQMGREKAIKTTVRGLRKSFNQEGDVDHGTQA